MKTFAKRLSPGTDLRKGIEDLAREAGIEAGVLLSIVGGLEKAVLRMAGSTPDDQAAETWNEDLEVVSGTGTFSKDGCHLHVALSGSDGKAVGGHLKYGCIVKFTAEIVVGELEGLRFTREPDEATGFKELVVSGTKPPMEK